MRQTLLTTCILAAFTGRGQAQVEMPARQDIPRVAASARGTVVLLKTFDRQGFAIGLGSGFRIAGGRYVTNAHVVAGAARVEIFDDSGMLLGIARFADMLSTTVDLAILPSVGPRAPYLALAGVAPAIGEKVIVIGAPQRRLDFALEFGAHGVISVEKATTAEERRKQLFDQAMEP